MARFVIVGAGATGWGVAERLADGGHDVTVVTRRGGGPERPGVHRIGLDAADAGVLADLVQGAQALFNCANPPYHRWATDWPPLASAMLVAAERSGAVLVTLSNLYAYGPPDGPLSPHDPLVAGYEKAQVRARMWHEALERHQRGALRAVEVRASDFVGPRADSMLGDRAVVRVVRGRRVWVIGDPDAPHSWTYVADVAACLVACALDESSWGRPWHVPTNPPRSSRQVVDDLADAAGLPRAGVGVVPDRLLRVAGLVSPLARELLITAYQFERPFVIDDTETREHLGLQPTPWSAVLDATLAHSPTVRQRTRRVQGRTRQVAPGNRGR